VNDPPSAAPLYLQDGDDAVFGVLHTPSPGARRGTAVLIVPPFGWEEICSYRSRRDWAQRLSTAGHTTLRIDLPSTGDSEGTPSDPARLAAWSAAVTSGASHLCSLAGCERVAAIGVGSGGLIICKALSEGAAIDEVVLWATPTRGRTFLRELRVFARLEDSEFDAPSDVPPKPLSDGYTGAGGFVLSAETTQALDELDVSRLELPTGRPARALLLERDGISVDASLPESFEEAGTTVTVADGPGYGAMMAKPHLAEPPLEVFALVQSWLEQSPSSAAASLSGASTLSKNQQDERPTMIELMVGDTRIRETPLSVEQPFGELFGVLAEPLDTSTGGLCVVMLNAGAIRRVGPNRMWVEAARRWAARGVPTLRLDLEGIGDADGDPGHFRDLAELYVPERIGQVLSALDVLEDRGMGSRYVLAGLCSGAHWSFHAALQDKRVLAALMLNPRTLFWNPSQQIARDFRRGLLRRSSWRRALRGEVPLASMLTLAVRAPFVLPRRALTRWYARRSGRDELNRALNRLLDTNKYIHFFFSGNEPLYEEFKLEDRLGKLGRWPSVSLASLPNRDHTLRPFEAQRAAHRVLDLALEDELRRVSASSPDSSAMGVVDRP
jgi:dienelactone hydrolase/pimeloyl-ACP methyl ester carboxylesterase